MMYYHEWLGTNEDYDKLVADIGQERVKPVASIGMDRSVQFVRVYDDRKGKWQTVMPGEYIMENAGEVWVEHGR
jgi:hypothetical protein